MSDPQVNTGPLTGGCACGAVQYRAETVKFVFACGCRACQHETGTGHATLVGVLRSDFALSGTPATWTRKGDSGETVTRAFCGTCGSPLWGAPDRAPLLYMLSAGSLDDPGRILPKRVLYRDDAPAWDLLPPDPED